MPGIKALWVQRPHCVSKSELMAGYLALVTSHCEHRTGVSCSLCYTSTTRLRDRFAINKFKTSFDLIHSQAKNNFLWKRVHGGTAYSARNVTKNRDMENHLAWARLIPFFASRASCSKLMTVLLVGARGKIRFPTLYTMLQIRKAIFLKEHFSSPECQKPQVATCLSNKHNTRFPLLCRLNRPLRIAPKGTSCQSEQD